MPLILHNVPDEELYTGDDGLKRPYAMIFGQNEAGPSTGTRQRRNMAESGPFGKSTRRSRSRTGTPARGARENPTLAAADKLFGDWVTGQNKDNSSSSAPARNAAAPESSNGAAASGQEDSAPQKRAMQQPSSTPVELILRGYRSASQQYAAVAHYEELAGAILEDYPRDPPAAQRRYKSDLRDPAYTRRRGAMLAPEVRARVNQADGGEHWVKVTFESADAARAAVYASPQRILGHLVYAEPYRGMAPGRDEACPDTGDLFSDGIAPGVGGGLARSYSVPVNVGGAEAAPSSRRTAAATGGGLPQSFSSRLLNLTAPQAQSQSRRSSDTLDTATLSQSRASTGTAIDPSAPNASAAATASGVAPTETPSEDRVFCRLVPTARRVRLLPAEEALLPQPSLVQRFVGAVPLIGWFGGSMIGNEVPRTETGEFDWNRASLYWKFIWWLDATFGLFRGDVYSIDKDE